MRILIVDDDYASRLKLKAIFSDYGDCDAVSDGDLCLRSYQSALRENVPYDLITMDINMPEANGFAVLEHIKDINDEEKVLEDKYAKVLMISVEKDLKNVSLSYYSGCDSYCTKPVTLEKIQEALKKINFLLE